MNVIVLNIEKVTKTIFEKFSRQNRLVNFKVSWATHRLCFPKKKKNDKKTRKKRQKNRKLGFYKNKRRRSTKKEWKKNVKKSVFF